MSETTCGPKFQECLTYFTTAAQTPVELFAAGFAAGEAEKVYLGACRAAMFRPSEEHRTWILRVAVKLVVVYGLEVSLFERVEINDEIWIHKPEARDELSQLSQMAANSPEWHTLRGRLCGIPDSNIDPKFHERKGYGERCDDLIPKDNSARSYEGVIVLD